MFVVVLLFVAFVAGFVSACFVAALGATVGWFLTATCLSILANACPITTLCVAYPPTLADIAPAAVTGFIPFCVNV